MKMLTEQRLRELLEKAYRQGFLDAASDGTNEPSKELYMNIGLPDWDQRRDVTTNQLIYICDRD